MARIRSVNAGRATQSGHATVGRTGIDKRPVAGAVAVRWPGPKGAAGSGLATDEVCDLRHHGGPEQALYAYAREDLDHWQAALARELGDGAFGENLTTEGIDLSGARIGERWRIGERCIVEVSCPRIPCRTFAGWLGVRGWERAFTRHGAPGAYLRVIAPGSVAAGDTVRTVSRPAHEVTVADMFRALTTERGRLPAMLEAGDALPWETRQEAVAFVRGT